MKNARQSSETTRTEKPRAAAAVATPRPSSARAEKLPPPQPQQRSRPAASAAPAKRPAPQPAPQRSGKPKAVKTFVIDTNVLLHDPDSLFAFEEHNVVIPFAVLEEIDTFKKSNDDIGRSARQCIRHLDRLRTRGKLVEGVAWGPGDPEAGDENENESEGEIDASPLVRPRLLEDGRPAPTGVIRIEVDDPVRPDVLREDKADNRIIAVAWRAMQRGERAVFVSKDINARLKADAMGIQAEDYENKKIDASRLYTGAVRIDAPGDVIDELYRERMLDVARLAEALTIANGDGKQYVRRIEPNQFVVLHDAADESHSGLARRVGDTDHIVPVAAPRKPVFGVMARNIEQTMALDLLLDDEIKLVTLTGGAGTGKTLMALAAGMHKVLQEQRYDRLLVARPIMPMGRDIGYLPGDKEEKLSAWMQPIFDNLEYLLSTRGSQLQSAESKTAEQRIEKVLADGKLVLEPLTYIRGRSIPHQFMIVDEAQNLSPHEVKTIISRVGEGTKLILTGDVEQIDHPYLDASSNGLSYAVERLRDQRLVGHVTLAKSERSELASIAADKL